MAVCLLLLFYDVLLSSHVIGEDVLANLSVELGRLRVMCGFGVRRRVLYCLSPGDRITMDAFILFLTHRCVRVS